MSSEASSIDPRAFAEALEALPIDALHTKAAEIRNSMSHLRSSNEQMMPFADEGDRDCKEAMFENLVVIGRMNERIGLLRSEVERRGMRWADAEVEDTKLSVDGLAGGANGHLQNGDPASDPRLETRAPSGRLTDEELRARMMEQMDEDGEEEGVHL